MFGFGIPELIVLVVIFAPLILWLIALVDIIKSDFNGNNKIVWLIIVLLVPLLGAILYFLIGRKQKVDPKLLSGQIVNGKKFCHTCGEELNAMAEVCPKCGVRQQAAKSSGTNPLLVVLVVVIVGFGAIATMGILAAIAIPQFASYRVKAYNSAAIADLKNAKVSVETYYADHNNQYPESLDPSKIQMDKDVEIQYEKTGNDNYIIITTHKKGDKVYSATSGSSEIKWKYKKDQDGQFISL